MKSMDVFYVILPRYKKKKTVFPVSKGMKLTLPTKKIFPRLFKAGEEVIKTETPKEIWSCTPTSNVKDGSCNVKLQRLISYWNGSRLY